LELLLGDGEILAAKTIISNVDASVTFNELLDVRTKEASIINDLIVTPSMFIVYCGLRKRIEDANPYEGYHQLSWNGKYENGRQAQSGLYLVRLISGSQVITNKVH